MTKLLALLLSPFADHIKGVFGFCAKKKVGWINAIWDIAFVKDAHPVWNRANENSPRSAVDLHMPVVLVNLNMPISKFIFRPDPKPAVIAFDNSRHKAVAQWLCVPVVNSAWHI